MIVIKMFITIVYVTRKKCITEQLLEVRKASIAQILCAVGDDVSYIQPHAFYRDGPG